MPHKPTTGALSLAICILPVSADPMIHGGCIAGEI